MACVQQLPPHTKGISLITPVNVPFYECRDTARQTLHTHLMAILLTLPGHSGQGWGDTSACAVAQGKQTVWRHSGAPEHATYGVPCSGLVEHEGHGA